MALKTFKTSKNKVVRDGSGRANETVVDLSKFKNKKSRKLIYMQNIEAIRKTNFLIPNAKRAFNYLKLAFIEALILQNFNLKSHIRIKTNMSGYVISEIFNKLNLDSNALSNDLNLNRSDFG